MPYDYKAAGKVITDLMAQSDPSFAILWAQQGKMRPPPPFWGIRFGGLTPVGTVDTHSVTFNPANLGGEYQRTVVGNRYLTISCQAYALAAEGNPDPALIAMSKFAMLLQLPGTLDTLAAAGLGLAEVGPILNISAAIEYDWESRAGLDLRFLVMDDAVETTGYIATVVPPVGTLTQ